MKMITTEEAMSVTGHKTKSGFASWLDRYNNRHAHKRILRRRGMVDLHTLEEAIEFLSRPKSERVP